MRELQVQPTRLIKMPESDPASQCPVNCPNRAPEGVRIFGQNIDPVELVVHFAVLLVLLIPAVRRSNSDEFTWQEGLGWFGAIAAASAVVRIAPTARLNAYKELLK